MILETLNALDFNKYFKGRLAEALQENLESGKVFDLLPEEAEENLDEAFDSKDKASSIAEKLKKKHNDQGWGHGKKSDGKWYVTHSDHSRLDINRHIKSLNESDEQLDEHLRRDEIEADWVAMQPEERDIVVYLKELGRQLGSDPGAYENGVLELVFKNKDAVNHYADAIEDVNEVIGYEIEAYREVMVDGYMEDEAYDIDDVLFDKDFEFVMTVYIDPEIVTYSAVEVEVSSDSDFDDENGFITEVRRRIKVDFRGKRRIKMQCRPGFVWDESTHACLKITGADVAQKRKSMRRAVRTRKSKGQSFKVRVLRKTRKAKRFRKSMGLK